MNETGIVSQLSLVDTPTISNAIERLRIRNRTAGFCNRDMRCLTPELGFLCGYAVTAEVETMSPDTDGGLDEKFIELCEAIAATQSPSVVVLSERGALPEYSAHCGEIMATVFQKLGSVGLVSDGAVRDIAEVRAMGYRYFAPGLVASHGSFRVTRVQVPVTVCGLRVDPGDLLHGDENGLISIPRQAIEQLPELIEQVRNAEKKVLDLVRGDDFSLDELRRTLVH